MISKKPASFWFRPGALVLSIAALASPGYAQQAASPDLPIEEVIRRFAEKEKQFALARANYTYRWNVRVQELDANDRVRGEFQLTADIGFDSKGKRSEKIIYAPQVTLRQISMTKEDLEDLREIQPFVLTTDDIHKYDVKYTGKEKVDEIDCYVFEVGPKKIEKNQRYFEGKIWVDDRDLQIVKTYGKAVPDIRDKGAENLFPRFETYREQIDDYWFPTYTRAVDTLNFSTGKVRIREIVRYENYKKFQTDVKLTFGDEVNEQDKPTAPGAPADSTKAPALDPRYKKESQKN